MTSTPQLVTESGADPLAEVARRHLWMHFTRHSVYSHGEHVPIIVRGEGPYIWDDQGRKFSTGSPGCSPRNSGTGARNSH